MEKNLFSEFQPVSTEQWLETIKKDLKGASFDKLIRKTLDNLTFNPFYRKEDIENLPTTDILPEQNPFIRQTKLSNKWNIRLDFYFENTQKTAEKIKKLSQNGVNSFGIDFGEKFNLDFDRTKQLASVFNQDNYFNFKALHDIEKITPFLKELDFDLKGSINFDPFTKFLFTGNKKEFYEDLDKISTLYNLDFENFKVLSVNADKLANAGASQLQQIFISLNILSEILDFAQQKKFNLEKILKSIQFNFAIGSEYFLEIAKIAAFRYLYSKVLEAYKIDKPIKPFIHTTTLRRNKTIYDPYVNMLRTTIEGMAGVLSGADCVSIEPYNMIFEKPDDFSERIAKNQQLIFKYEAYLDKVIDPLGGSYYLEILRKKLIEAAWEKFLENENKGGFSQLAKNGEIQKQINDIAEKEQQLVNKGKKAILGTNKYPNRNEKIKDKKFYFPPQYKANLTDIPTIKEKRLAEDFENLRLTIDNLEKAPKVFLFTYGNVAYRRARADFSLNFFAAAGFEIIDNLGFQTIEDGIKKWEETKAQITVLCSSDDNYLQMAKEIVPKLQDKTILVIAGNPENRNEIEKIGIKNFIHIKSEHLTELKKYAQLLEINF